MDVLPEPQSVRVYMKNNEKLPDDVMEDLQRGLAKPRQELADLDAEIKELKERLTQLEVKRDRVEKYITQYECVLAPIRRLPADILHNIFYHCLPTRRNPIMSAKEAPILLTRICRTWRQIAHASPSLWARLYITFSDRDLLSSADVSHGLTQQYILVSDTLRLHCIAVEEWLSRSGACPLSISLYYTSYIWFSNDEYSPGNSEHTRTLFCVLARHSHRWQRLELRMPIEIYRMFEAMVPLSQLQMLNFIRTSFSRQIKAIGDPEDEPAITFWQARNLKRISLSIYPSPVAKFILSTPNLAKLTTLSIACIISITEATSLLKNCPNLEYATLFAVQVDPIPSTQPQGVISLPHLRALSFTDAVQPESACMFYECIDAPQMEWLDYTRGISYSGRNQVSPDHTPIITLLQRLTNLRKLTITGNFISTSELRRMLRSAQSINHLVFGPEIRTNKNSLGPSPDFASTSPRYNLGDLFLKDGEEETRYDPGLPLLPCLEILEISQAASTYVTDEVLRDIILRRSNALPSNDVALLKKVAVLFSRAKKIDISKELSTHSNAGKVELQLGYLDRTPWQDMHFVCSGYGVDELDRSWQYRDIEVEMIS